MESWPKGLKGASAAGFFVAIGNQKLSRPDRLNITFGRRVRTFSSDHEERVDCNSPWFLRIGCRFYPHPLTEELLRGVKGLERIYRPEYRYKKAGVMLDRLVPAGPQTQRPFGNADYERSRRVMRVVAEINARHGRDTVRLGTARPGGRGQTKFMRGSPATPSGSKRCSPLPECDGHSADLSSHLVDHRRSGGGVHKD